MKDTREILDALANGKLSVDEAEKELQDLFLTEVSGIGVLDINRQERSGVPEVIFGESKGIEVLGKIVGAMLEKKGVALITRIDTEKLDDLKKSYSEYTFIVTGHDGHLTVLIHQKNWKEPAKIGKIAVVTAGTSDVAYAAEAEAVARLMGVDVMSFHDVGVAGMHRLIEPVKKILKEDVDALVVFAGMEGALPTLLASLVDIPVIGVPVPTGYGHGGAGETALASMLQSCAPGLTVVNIGNGLGAGSFACLIARRRMRHDG
jgi:NCAIR mutase (PurE)-related protein